MVLCFCFCFFWRRVNSVNEPRLRRRKNILTEARKITRGSLGKLQGRDGWAAATGPANHNI